MLLQTFTKIPIVPHSHLFLLENSLPKVPASMESNHTSPNQANSSHSTPTSRNGGTEPSTTPSTSGASAKDHGNMPIIVPIIPPPLIKPPAGKTSPRMAAYDPVAPSDWAYRVNSYCVEQDSRFVWMGLLLMNICSFELMQKPLQ